MVRRSRATAPAWAGAILWAAVLSAGCFSSSSPGGAQDAGGSLDAPPDTLGPDTFAVDSAQAGSDAQPDLGVSDTSGEAPYEAGAVDAPLEAGQPDTQADASPADAPSEAAATDAWPQGGDAAEAGADTGNVPNDGGGCSVVATWSGTYSCASLDGEGFTWVIGSDGSAVGTIGDAATVGQTWSLSGDTISITDVSGSSCGSGVVGTYTVAFSASCAQMTLTAITDPCTGRGSCVNGLVVARQ